MANYSLVINSQFKPFSYQEMLAPTLMATQAHQELENQYGELAAKANVWEEMANEQTDPYAYKMYKTYANDLEEQAGQLAREGLNAASRKDMLNMRARYSKEIIPIEQAYNRRKELADEQRKLSAQNPTMLWQRNASTMSLDDFIKNPSIDYGEKYSGAMITQQVATAAANMAKEARDSEEGRRKLRQIIPYQYEVAYQKGFSREAVMKAILNEPDASKILTGLVDSAITTSGVLNWGDKNTVARAYDYARQGLYNAIGETTHQIVTDQAGLATLQADLADRNAKRAEARAAAREQQAKVNNLAINPLNIYSNRELSDKEKKYKNSIKNFSKYFYTDKNGQVRMTYKGWQEYNRNATPRVSPGMSGGSTARLANVETLYMNNKGKNTFTPTAFRTFMDSIGASKAARGWQPGTLGNVWKAYVKGNPAASTSRYDATKVTEYDYTIAGAQQSNMKDAIMTAGRGLSLKEVDYDSRSKKFKDTGKEITMEDLKSDKYKVTATRFSPYGSTVMIQDDKGNVRRYRMPAGINTTNEQNRDRAMTAANKWQQVVSTGQYTDARGRVHQATPDEITYAQQQYANSIQQAYLFHSQLGVQNKTKEQEFNPYGY